jgi:hypothetical protein
MRVRDTLADLSRLEVWCTVSERPYMTPVRGTRPSLQPRPVAFMAPATVPLVEGAAALVFGTGFFGFLASRLPRFFSVAMISLLDGLRSQEAPFTGRLSARPQAI